MFETVGTMLLQLPDDILLKLLNNIRNEKTTNILLKECYTTHDAINASFHWNKSLEGEDYWKNMYIKYKEEYELNSQL